MSHCARICGLVAAALLVPAVLSITTAPAQASGDPRWPAARCPFSLADRIMNGTTIARSGGLGLLRSKTAAIFTPAFEIVSFDASSFEALPVSGKLGFVSYALGSKLFEDASTLLFADGLFMPSDTLQYLRGVTAYDIHDFAKAADCFSSVPQDSPYHAQAQSFLDVWNSTPVIPGYKEKSPLAAAALSAVIPGAGKMYAGDLRSGVSTLLVVGALGGMFAESWSKLGLKDWRTIALGSVFGIFYIGNIYGSALSVSVVRQSYSDAEKATLLFNLRVPLHQF